MSNERPIVISYKGDILFPVFNDYPEDRFGGFLAHTDYRNPETAKEIEDHGWMVWAPNRYSNTTRNLSPPTTLPSPPTWMLRRRAMRESHRATRAARRRPRIRAGRIETNWLGTDDHGRDVLARLIYGFRLSVVFALLLAGISSVVGIAAGAVQGYFGGWTDLIMQRVIEIWSSLPHLYILIIVAAVITPSFLVLLGILLLVLLGEPRPSRAGRVPAGAQLRICERRPRAGAVERAHHGEARAAQRHGGDPDVPALHPAAARSPR